MIRYLKLTLALTLLALFHLAVLFAGFLAPYGPAEQHRDLPFAPPAHIRLVDARHHLHPGPFVYRLADDPAHPGKYVEDTAAAYPIHFFAEGAAYKIAGLIPVRRHLFGIDEPATIFLFGSDGLGRDQFTRFLFGGELSLPAGVLAAVLSVSLGLLVGGIAGYYGGWLDELLMRGVELFLALPWLYLLFAVRAALPLEVSETQTFLLLVTVVGLLGWARPARLIRGVVLSARERNFVLAARGFGGSDAYLLWRHVLPEARSVALTQLTLLVPQYILAEVTLTYMGLGVGEPLASWGTLFSALSQYYVLATDWWMFLPPLLLIPLFFAYYVAADAMQDYWKPVVL